MDVDSLGWSASIELKGLTKEASKQGWDEASTKLQDGSILNPSDLSEATWESMENVLRNEERKQHTLKIWLAARAEEPMVSDRRRRELGAPQLRPSIASELADAIAGGSVGDS